MFIPNNIPNSLQLLLSRYQNKIEDFTDERDTKDGYWIYLRPGYCWPDEGFHTIHMDTVKEISIALQQIRVCDCSVCFSLSQISIQGIHVCEDDSKHEFDTDEIGVFCIRCGERKQ